MAVRFIRPYHSSNEYVEKYVDMQHYNLDIDWTIPVSQFLQVEGFYLPSRLKLACAQQMNEISLWNLSTPQERKILAPIIDLEYNKDGPPSLIMPRFQPLCLESESFQQHHDIDKYLDKNGITRNEWNNFKEQVVEFCDNWALADEDLLNNYNNIGFHPCFGIRLLDYGLSTLILENYLKEIKLTGVN